jgi:uncharacterized zinc-type alcohol dehydrogenase-like protein
MSVIDAWVAPAAKQKLVREKVDLGPLGAEDVEIQVEHCGLCHSDLTVLQNDLGFAQFPAVLGHEAIGTIVEVGSAAKGLKKGQRVGVGWFSGSCMHCRQCLSGDQNLCANTVSTILGHRGGFASRVRAHWAWAIPIPEGLPAKDAGPLLCGGITVFNPLAVYASSTSRVGILGIGGLGHMAVKFAAAMGCDVTAFTSSENKFDEARSFGARHVVTTKDKAGVQKLAGSLDLLLVTTNVQLDWAALINTLAPKGRLHVLGLIAEPMPIPVIPLLLQQRSVSSSPTGSPVGIETMLEFADRNKITPTTEHFPMSKINDAFDRLHSGKARYRIVLDADF